MSTKLADTIDTNTPNLFYDERFRVMIEHHLPTLKSMQGSKTIELTAKDKEDWDGNFDGFLFHKAIPVYMHWIITRVNGLDSSTDFRGQLDRVIIPSTEKVNRIRDYFNTIHNI